MQTLLARKLWPLFKKLGSYVIQVYDRIDLNDNKSIAMENFVNRTEEAVFEETKEFLCDLSEEAEVIHSRDLDQEQILKPKLWVVTPIDGKENLSSQIPMMTLNLSLFEAGELKCSMVYDIVSDILYSSQPKKGSFSNQVRIRARSSIESALYIDDTANQILSSVSSKFPLHSRSIGCSSLGIAWTAAGKSLIYTGPASSLTQSLPAIMIALESGHLVRLVDDNLNSREIDILALPKNEPGNLVIASPRVLGTILSSL
tara:strand:+ start:2817 stop:3590 length:774 start_codon:yes stop_codon:yes gene_type:complete